MWKTLGGRCIYQAPNGAQVHQNLFYRWLHLGSDALQTLINRRYPEKISLGYIHQLAFAARQQPADCCLLGLGGAGVAHALSPYMKSSQLLAIENNQEVIEIAKEYFMIEQIKNLSVTYQDANLFVQQCKTKYKHVLVDLYESQSFPEHCNNHDFFLNCQRLMLPGGILALNLTHSEEQWPIFNHLRDVFCKRTVSLPVKNAANLIVLACNSSSVSPLLSLLKNSGCLKELEWDARWGCIAKI